MLLLVTTAGFISELSAETSSAIKQSTPRLFWRMFLYKKTSSFHRSPAHTVSFQIDPLPTTLSILILNENGHFDLTLKLSITEQT